MANTVNITKVIDGPRNVVIHVYIASDGASGDLVDQVLIDPVVDLNLKPTERMSVESITSSMSGFHARVEYDTGLVEDKMVWVITEHDSLASFQDIGGLKDRSGVDGTGKFQITTTGLTSVGDEGTFIFQVKK